MLLNIAILSVPVAYITHKIVEKLYPGQTKKMCILYGWKLIQCSSYVELKVSRVYHKIKALLPTIKSDPVSVIRIIKDGDETAQYDINDFLALKNNDNDKNIPNYDFILYEIPVANSNIKHMVRYDSHEHIAKIEYNAINDFKLSVIQFNFKHSEKTININFNDNQFMITGNILFDRKFLKWYMNKYHKITIKNDDKYSVTFIDHNMNYIILNDTKHIIIKTNNYDVIDNNDNKCSIEDSFTIL